MQRAVAAAGFQTPPVRVAGGPDDGLAWPSWSWTRHAPALPSSRRYPPACMPRLLRQILTCSPPRRRDCTRWTPSPSAISWRTRASPVTIPGLLAVPGAVSPRRRRTSPVPPMARSDTRPASPDVSLPWYLHPFNLLADGCRGPVLDWSAAMLAPARTTSPSPLQLAEPPVDVPAGRATRPPSAIAGPPVPPRLPRHAAVTVGPELSWRRSSSAGARWSKWLAGYVRGG